jgi:hypothetical protein
MAIVIPPVSEFNVQKYRNFFLVTQRHPMGFLCGYIAHPIEKALRYSNVFPKSVIILPASLVMETVPKDLQGLQLTGFSTRNWTHPELPTSMWTEEKVIKILKKAANQS